MEAGDVRSSPGATRWFHVSAAARRRYALPAASFGLRGRLLVGGWSEAQTLAQTINDVRDARRFPELAVRAGDVYAAAVIHELMHALIASMAKAQGETTLAGSPDAVRSAVGDERYLGFLRAFVETFPSPGVAGGARSASAYLLDATMDEGRSVPNPEVVLEEAYLVHMANANPALERMEELFDDAPLRREGVYPTMVAVVESALRAAGRDGAELAADGGGADLLELLWAPQRASPTSLEGQLKVIRERWSVLLGGRYRHLMDDLLRAIDMLEEERRARGGGPVPGTSTVLDAGMLSGGGAIEAFSADSDWMPSVVMIAKSAFVWLHQLERSYGREVRRLDQVPEAALQELAGRGFNALWLIGIWQRSEASKRIKRMRGQADAVASAYALYDYVIADDMGGEAAYAALRDRAAAAGLRLASDMVPNHVGIDGRWVAEHPEWFIQLDHPPYPGYRFEGADLSGDDRIAVRIEDHYWNDSDAAVVFQRIDKATGEVRYLYHGNDGTSMPWNDTAQLDYLRADVREAAIQAVLHVARLFPIIRFDAAMTLAKEHVRRLWYPAPGHGGAIPSRSQYGAMSTAEFERLMPHEFWREVVDRVAVEAPGTLLLAEAFWMMEGYFVRSLGMHRVYNSAFMNMLKREDNAEYRATIKNVLAFDPRVLERFVNFMNNPDEETAIAQFGDGDKYFGVTTLMATLPGLPLFGHGQVEGLKEKYGMEYRTARWDETPDQRLIDRHQRQIAPLLRRRKDFAGASRFRLYDLVGPDGGVDENVFAYSNDGPGGTSLVLYNNRFERAAGRLHRSAPFVERQGQAERSQSLAEALGLPRRASSFVLFDDVVSTQTWLARADALHASGLDVRLDGFETRVFLDLRVVEDVDGSYAAVANRLDGRGTRDLEALRRATWYAEAREAFVRLLRAAAAGSWEQAAVAGRAFVAASERRGVLLRPAGTTAERDAAAPGGTTAIEDVDGGVRRPVDAHGHISAGTEAEPEVQPGAQPRPAPGPEPGPEPRPETSLAEAVDVPGVDVPDVTALLLAGLTAANGATDVAGAALPSGTTVGEGARSPERSDAASDETEGQQPISVWRDAAAVAVHRTDLRTDDAGLVWVLRAVLALSRLEAPAELYRQLGLGEAVVEDLGGSAGTDGPGLDGLGAVLLDLKPVVVRGEPRDVFAAVTGSAAAASYLQVHDADGVAWFGAERYRALRDGLLALASATRPAVSAATVASLAYALDAAEVTSEYRFERLRALGLERPGLDAGA